MTNVVHVQAKAIKQYAAQVDQWACQALLDEVSLEHKPGLVCPTDQGSHIDMDYALFLKSIASLRGYFYQQVLNGYYQRPLSHIRACGIHAEENMLLATKNINTHKGAIFNLGFVCAAIGRCKYAGQQMSAMNIAEMIKNVWGFDLLNHFQRHPEHHGQQVRKKYAVNGAIEEVASGFQTVIHLALPLFQSTQAQLQDSKLAALQSLFGLISCVQDTNMVWRGGLSALLIAQDIAKNFLTSGGVYQADWQAQVQEVADYFIQHRLSPGGSADLLGVTLFLHQVEHECSHSI
jgi:triphosphoribosyl-dephospho-CoA synthase